MQKERHSQAIGATYSGAPSQAINTNKVLRQTWMLLGMTLAFSAGTAGVSMALNLPHPGLLLTLGGYVGLLFLTFYLRNSAWGLASVFALTGFMGYTLGPILNYYTALPNGGQIVTMALGGTATIFLAMSFIALTSKKDFSFLGNFLAIGILTAFIGGLAAYFFNMPALSLMISGVFVLLMAGLILFETQQIIRGGETNYIMATVTLYVSIYNLFVSLLHLLGAADD